MLFSSLFGNGVDGIFLMINLEGLGEIDEDEEEEEVEWEEHKIGHHHSPTEAESKDIDDLT